MLIADPCAYCGAPADVLDHVVSRRRGGGNDWGNLAPACWSCNSSKGQRSLLAWLAYRSFLRAELDAARELSRRWMGVGA